MAVEGLGAVASTHVFFNNAICGVLCPKYGKSNVVPWDRGQWPILVCPSDSQGYFSGQASACSVLMRALHLLGCLQWCRQIMLCERHGIPPFCSLVDRRCPSVVAYVPDFMRLANPRDVDPGSAPKENIVHMPLQHAAVHRPCPQLAAATWAC